jgi:magnesium chelatase family protein
MALGRTLSIARVGMRAHVVEVEVDVASGLPRFTLTALADRVLGQVEPRVKSAVTNSGERWPNRRVTVALSPAMVPKSGSGFDVAVACALLVADEALPAEPLRDTVVLGELALDGRIRGVPGVLPAVIGAAAAGFTRVVVPRLNLVEARLVPGVDVVGAGSLTELCAWLRGERSLSSEPEPVAPAPTVEHQPDLADVAGQPVGRRAVEVAAAGGHHLLMTGPPGVGKTMLAERLPGLLPDLTDGEALEVTAIHSVAGRLAPGRPLITRPPYCAPHHTASVAAVVGGGTGIAAPGAASFAHRGVLFLDEAPEFRREALDALRQPLETGEVTLARSAGVATYPARFLLVLAANPCACATATGAGREPASCRCTSTQRRRYFERLSGPLLDRVDLRVALGPVPRTALVGGEGEPTATVRARVAAARERARERLRGTPWLTMAEVPGPVVRRRWPLPAAVTRPLYLDLDRGVVSARGVDRALRVVWTIADLAGRAAPTADDVDEVRFLRSSALLRPPVAVTA